MPLCHQTLPFKLQIFITVSVLLSHTLVVSSLCSALINCLMGLVVAVWGLNCQPVRPSRARFGDSYRFPCHRHVLFETGVNYWDSEGAAQINMLLYKLSLSPAGTHSNTHRNHGCSQAMSDTPTQTLDLKNISAGWLELTQVQSLRNTTMAVLVWLCFCSAANWILTLHWGSSADFYFQDLWRVCTSMLGELYGTVILITVYRQDNIVY